MIAAGVNAKALSSYMGHSSIQVTLDRYALQGAIFAVTWRSSGSGSTSAAEPGRGGAARASAGL